jgi:hypothetical protein
MFEHTKMQGAAIRINARLAEASRGESRPVAFVCECGRCNVEVVPLTLEEFDEIRAREDLVLAPGHN